MSYEELDISQEGSNIGEHANYGPLSPSLVGGVFHNCVDVGQSGHFGDEEGCLCQVGAQLNISG